MSSNRLIFMDDFTHEEIIFFMRQGKLYGYLRNRETKRFIKRLYKVFLIYRGVFERCYEERKGRGKTKSNNIHLETHLSSELEVSPYLSIEELLEVIKEVFQDLKNRALEECFDKYDLTPETEEYALSSEPIIEEPCYMDRCE